MVPLERKRIDNWSPGCFNQGGMTMQRSRSTIKGYILSMLFGVILGGLTTAAITRAIPKMMGRMMCSMMSGLAGQMGEDGVDPEDM